MNASPFGRAVVESTPEIARIAALPRRTWTDEAAAKLAEMLTRELKTPGGTMTLRPVQAVALYEAMECGGLFGPIAVGRGKTSITLASPARARSQAPSPACLPATLVEKTWHDRKILAEHWRLPTNLQIISYELLGLVQSAQKLEYIRPDWIITDECFLPEEPARRAHPAGRAVHGQVPRNRFRRARWNDHEGIDQRLCAPPSLVVEEGGTDSYNR